MSKTLLAAAVLALSAGAASASPVMGSTLNYQYYFPTAQSAYGNASNGNFKVGNGVEITNVVDHIGKLNVTSTQIIVDFAGSSTFNAAAFSGWILTDVFKTIDAFTSVTIDAATNWAGFDTSRLSFTADTISVNWQGLSFDQNTRLVLDFSTSVRGADAAGSSVPEPASLALASLALLGLGVTRRSQKKRDQA